MEDIVCIVCGDGPKTMDEFFQRSIEAWGMSHQEPSGYDKLREMMERQLFVDEIVAPVVMKKELTFAKHCQQETAALMSGGGGRGRRKKKHRRLRKK